MGSSSRAVPVGGSPRGSRPVRRAHSTSQLIPAEVPRQRDLAGVALAAMLTQVPPCIVLLRARRRPGARTPAAAAEGFIARTPLPGAGKRKGATRRLLPAPAFSRS